MASALIKTMFKSISPKAEKNRPADMICLFSHRTACSDQGSFRFKCICSKNLFVMQGGI